MEFRYLDIRYEPMDLSSRIRKLEDRHILYSHCGIVCPPARAQFLSRRAYMYAHTCMLMTKGHNTE